MATAPPPRHPHDEMWMPRCPRCGESQLILAPANQYTKGIVAQVEVYCPSCQWQARLVDNIKAVYVRL